MFTVEYWLHHYEYAMGHKPKLDEDTSNVNWTRNNLTKILNGEMPYGMTGTNGAKALIKYIKIYNPDKVQEVAKLMLEYIESIQAPERPLTKVHNYYASVIDYSKSIKGEEPYLNYPDELNFLDKISEDIAYVNKEEAKEKEILKEKINALRDKFDYCTAIFTECEDGTKIIAIMDTNGLGEYIDIEEKASTFLVLNMKLDFAITKFEDFMDCGYEPTMDDLCMYADKISSENRAYEAAQAEIQKQKYIDGLSQEEAEKEAIELLNELNSLSNIKPEPENYDSSFNNDLPQISSVADTQVQEITSNNMTIDNYFSYVITYPLKLVWNLLLLVLTIWAFIAWWGLIFGSIIAIVLILIFDALHILILPALILGFIAPLTPINSTDEEKPVIHTLGLLATAFIIYITYRSIAS